MGLLVIGARQAWHQRITLGCGMRMALCAAEGTRVTRVRCIFNHGNNYVPIRRIKPRFLAACKLLKNKSTANAK